MGTPANAENLLEQALLQGRWALFERLPAERRLAADLGISRATLRTALRTLVGRGILETRRSSGTFVRALPSASQTSGLDDSLQAMHIIMPPLLSAVAGSFAPSVMLTLERLLPSVGMALHSGDMRLLAKYHLHFFSTLLQAVPNARLAQAGLCTLPDAHVLTRLLEGCGQVRLEELFKHLARTLHGLRHADPQASVAAVTAYVSCLLQYREEGK